MQIIFQDPYSSLNPRMTVGSIVGEPLKIHGLAKGKDLQDQVDQLTYYVLGYVQSITHAIRMNFLEGSDNVWVLLRALALRPKFIVCDEAVSALDVSIQAQIINLLKDLQQEFQLAYLFITHDLNVVEYLAHRIAVMYLGKLSEVAPS